MIRFILRTAGFVLMAAAFASLVVDGTRSVAAQHIAEFSLGDTLGWLAGAHFTSSMQGLVRWPALAQQLVRGFLAVPSWLVTGTLGLLFLYAGRPPAPRIGFLSR
jgi:hypothetical protein